MYIKLKDSTKIREIHVQIPSTVCYDHQLLRSANEFPMYVEK